MLNPPRFRFIRFSYRTIAVALLTLLTLPSAEAKWWKAQTGNISIISNARKAEIEKIDRALWEARLALQILFPNLSQLEQSPLLIIYPGDAKTYAKLTFATGRKRKSIAGFFTYDNDGHYAVVTEGNYGDISREVIIHEYIHFLTKSANTKPIWLSEGLAELFSTINELNNGNLAIGEPRVNSIRYLRYEGTMSMERLLQIDRSSPEYGSNEHSGTLYSQSWLFLHYLMFGDGDLPPEKVKEFMAASLQKPRTNKALVTEYLGLSFEDLDEIIKNYLHQGRFNRLSLSIDESNGYVPPDFVEASERDISRLLARISLNSKDLDESIKQIQESLAAFPEDPQIKSVYGEWLLKNDQYRESYTAFNEAFDQGYETPRVHMGLAASYLGMQYDYDFEANGLISREDTLTSLTHLFKARQLGATYSARLYHLIGYVWLNSEVSPEDRHMEIVQEGLNLHPGSFPLASSLSEFYRRSNRLEKSQEIIQQTFPFLTKEEQEELLGDAQSADLSKRD